MSLQDQFVSDVERFLSQTGTLPTVFGKEALGDPNFVFNLRQGRSPSLRTIDKVRGWMREKKPDFTPSSDAA